MDADYTAAYARLYREHWWWRVRERILVAKIREALNGGARPARILDVGCGAGLLFDALEPFGHVEGIESDPIALEHSGRWRARIHHGELDDAFTPGAPFDLILMLDVLEHVDDPGQLVRRAAALLPPAGRMMVTVPAFDWLWTSHDDINHHLKRYTAAELGAVLEAAGLVITETQYLFQSLVLPKLAVRARERLIGSRPGIPGIPPAALNAAIQTWFRAEYAVAGWLPFGSSVLAIARRG